MKLTAAFVFSLLTMGAFPMIDSISGAASFKNKKFDELKTAGSVDLENVSAYSIFARGALSFTDLTVEDTITTKGGCKGDGLAAKSLVCQGGTTINKAKVDVLEAHGGFSGEDIEVTKDFSLFGGLKATRLVVHGLTTITGEAKFVESTLEDVVCAGKKQEFKNTLVHSIRVTSADGGTDTGFTFLNWILSFFRGSKTTCVRIYLSGRTIVKGDIVFESAPGGEVHLSGEATLGGQVKGGVIINA